MFFLSSLFTQKLYESQTKEIVDKDKQIADLQKDLTAKSNLAEVYINLFRLLLI
jgi:hypothetical protein